ncbi:glutamate-1-semialdehyde-2,1-aminomutase [Beggiatoa sp. SS]|nr:glutamate-1-semialdehyde-2,1-aminomutase [Beggiatoa sp. SS]
MSQVVSQQLAFLQNVSVELPSTSRVSTSVPTQDAKTSQTKKTAIRPSSLWGNPEIQGKKLTSQQQHHLDSLIARYTKCTQKSKQQEQAYRSVFADMRTVLNFRIETKEMCYPIIAESFQGSKIRDIDDNEYIDLTMGFGVHLFGHQPGFITTALEYQLKQGMSVGPQSKLAGEVAELICELTNMQRVTYCNSGTEAVMTALRIARSATGRDKVVLFSGSYHGHYDGTLAVSATEDGQSGAVPMASGVLQKNGG